MIDVSIIAPVYCVEKYIRQSVQAMLNQTHKNIEIILVDDGSPDRSGEICDEIAAQDKRVKVIHKKNEGTGYARNTGMDAASGEYLYFCDPDDLMDPKLVEDNYRLAEQNDADIVVFGFKTVWLDRNGSAAKRTALNIPQLNGVYDYQAFWEHFETAGEGSALWNSLFRRAFIQAHNLRHTNLSNGQDAYFRFDVYSVPFSKIVYHSGIYYTYIRRAASSTLTFKPGRIMDEYTLSQRLETLIEHSPYPHEQLQPMIYKRYVEGLVRGVENAAAGGKIPMREKAAVIRDFMAKDKIKTSMRAVCLHDFRLKRVRVTVFLLRLGLCRTAMRFVKWHRILQNCREN